MSNINTFAGQTGRIVRLVRDLGKVITVPEGLAEEVRLFERIKGEVNSNDAAVAAARNTLTRATTPDDYMSARKALSDTMVTAYVTGSDGFREAEADALYRRLLGTLSSHSDELQRSLSDTFNAVVEAHKLNIIADGLPDLSDKYLNPLNLSVNQAQVLTTWKNASVDLDKVWNAYTRLGNHLGHTFGGRQESDNLDLVFQLFDVTTFDDARVIADVLAAWKSGTDAAKRFGQLLPFIAGPLAGVDLLLKPIDDAATQRQAVQFEGA